MTETITPTRTLAKPAEEKIEWVSLEEAEKLQKYIGRQYIKKGDEKDAKQFFYKILDIFPYQPMAKDMESMFSTENQLYKFNVQKYYRNKTRKAKRRDEGGNQVDVDANEPVESHEMRNGNWVCVDPMASFPMDTKKFKEQFEPDTQE